MASMSTPTERRYFFLDREADMGIAVGTLAEMSELATCVIASPLTTNFPRSGSRLQY
jgi:hypothetical protein